MAIGGATAAVAIGAWATVALGALTALNATSPTRLAPQLTWTDDATATDYDVDRSPGTCPGTAYAPVASGLMDKSFSDGLHPDGAYCYRVTGHYPDAAGTPTPDSLLTKEIHIDTAPPTAPAVSFAPAPTGSALHGIVTIVPSSTDPGGSGIATGVASYVVSIDGAAPLAGAQWDTATVSDALHEVHATAIDGAGNQSPTTTIQVAVKNSLPGAPIVSAQSPVAGKPTLTWTAVPGEAYSISRDGSTVAANVTSGGVWTDPAALEPGTYSYVVTAVDAAGHATSSAPLAVTVIPPSVTAPRSVAANSPTNVFPHLTWQSPVTFAVLNWRVFRDGVPLAPLLPAVAESFDDATLTAQGPHMYAVQAVNGGIAGDMSSPVSVTYDTIPPTLASASATANPNGSIAISWPAAIDAAPGAGIASYVVRRSSPAPPDASSGTAVCTLAPPAAGCTDTTAKNGTFYGYAVFAIDGAGNVARREASAKSSDTQAPAAVTGLKVLSSDFSYARLGWDVPATSDTDADLAGYRVLQLREGAKTPLNPQDGTIVCRNVDPQGAKCDALNLTRGKKVTFAVYAFDDVPNYSAPSLISVVPEAIDRKAPHKPTKVKLVRAGLRYTLMWKSPRDRDLSKFRVTLYNKGPAKRPSRGKAVVTGRVLHASFTLKAGQVIYVNLFALDVSGNFSRVTKLIVVPDRPFEARSKHKVVKKKTKQAAGKDGSKQPKKHAKPKKPKKPKQSS